MKKKNGESSDELKRNAGEEKLSRRTAIKRIAAVFAGVAISATGAAGNDKLAFTENPPYNQYAETYVPPPYGSYSSHSPYGSYSSHY